MTDLQVSHKSGRSRMYSVNNHGGRCKNESISNSNINRISISIRTDLLQFQPWAIDDLPPTPNSNTRLGKHLEKSSDNIARESREFDSESVLSTRLSTSSDCNSETSGFDVDAFRAALTNTLFSANRLPYPSLISHIVPMETVAEECFNLADSGATGDFSFINSDYDEYSFQYNTSSYNTSPTNSITSLRSSRSSDSDSLTPYKIELVSTVASNTVPSYDFSLHTNSPILNLNDTAIYSDELTSLPIKSIDFPLWTQSCSLHKKNSVSTIGSNDSFAGSIKATSAIPNFQQSFFQDLDINNRTKTSTSITTAIITATVSNNSEILCSSSSIISLSSTVSANSVQSVETGNLMSKNNVAPSSPLKTTPPSKRFYYFNSSAKKLASPLAAARRTPASPLATNTQSISTKRSPQTQRVLSFDRIEASSSPISRKLLDSNILGILPKAKSSTRSLFNKRAFDIVEALSMQNDMLNDSINFSGSVVNGVATEANQHAVAYSEATKSNSEATSCNATINSDNTQLQQLEQKIRGWKKFVQDVKGAAQKFVAITAETSDATVTANLDQSQYQQRRQKFLFSGWAPSLSMSTSRPQLPSRRNKTPITEASRMSADLPRQFIAFSVLPLNGTASVDQQLRRPGRGFSSKILGGGRASLDETTPRIGGDDNDGRSYEIAAETMEVMDASRMMLRAFSAHGRMQKSSYDGRSESCGENGMKQPKLGLRDRNGEFLSAGGSNSSNGSSSKSSSNTKDTYVGLDTVFFSEDTAYSLNGDNTSSTLASQRSIYRVDLPTDVLGAGATKIQQNVLMDEFEALCNGGDDNDWNGFRKKDIAPDGRCRLDGESASITSVTPSHERNADTIRVRLLQQMDVSKKLERFYRDVCSGDLSVHEIAGYVNAVDY
ncbi:hypothetical protein HK100_007063 [Physocladia obscura]|uniref:Uncharacterized protein n=1 Tax=Physocladia obscura TaxID=109957 RepID=A0AAD5SS07_9FUNG|nr:hypothetical protein HK100_007063 [Physocladia obscura]